MVRYPGIALRQREPEYEIAAQYFSWVLDERKYIGERLEIRLWGVYLSDFIESGAEDLKHIQNDPASLLQHSEVTAGRETGYVALYQMQRPPSKISVGRSSISAWYQGENDAARDVILREGRFL
jgi:hypothetical protein